MKNKTTTKLGLELLLEKHEARSISEIFTKKINARC